MIASLRAYWSVAACFARLGLQRQMEYPLFLFTWLVSNPLQYLFGVWLLKTIVDRFHPLAGWSLPQLAFIYGLGLISHGLVVLLFVQSWSIDNMIGQGEFDRLLMRPLNVFFQFSVCNITLIGLTDLIPAVLIFAYACHQVHFAATLSHTITVLLVVVGATLLRAGIFTIIGSAAFWTRRSGPLIQISLSLLERGTLYPATIYPYLMQVLLTFLLPVGFVSFYPACDFLHQRPGLHGPLALALWTPVVGVIVFYLGQLVFTAGLRRYESTGS